MKMVIVFIPLKRERDLCDLFQISIILMQLLHNGKFSSIEFSVYYTQILYVLYGETL